MARILWHSCAPWDGTGYGTQTATWTRYLAQAGHDVAISSYHGSPGRPVVWDGIPVFPPPMAGPPFTLLPANAAAHKADLIIILADVWLMPPELVKDYRSAVWLPTDTDKVSIRDYAYLKQSHSAPVAMSLDGKAKLERAGWQDVLYVPHGIDTSLFKPPEDRQATRAAFGLEASTFAFGLNGNNIDPVRKGYPEQMAAFARFHGKHPDSRLFIHSIAQLRSEGSLDLDVLAADLGIRDAVAYCDQYTHLAGGYTQEDMAAWYGAMDVVGNASYGEGFGLAAVEAQACGTPVILSRGTTGPQLCGPAKWLVPTSRRWNQVHGGWWHAPSEDGILRRLEEAWTARGSQSLRDRCRAWALQYDVGQVAPLWDHAIEVLTEGLDPGWDMEATAELTARLAGG